MKKKILFSLFIIVILIICGLYIIKLSANTNDKSTSKKIEKLTGIESAEEVTETSIENVTETVTTEETAETALTESTETPTETAPAESTEVVAQNEFNVADCEPTTKYTNTNANIRAIPDKTGDLINTVSINTELVVTGTTDTGWSRVENSGVVCFIKSSLLSDTKTEVKQPSNSGGTSSGGASQSGSTSTPQQPSQPQTPSGGGAAAGDPFAGGQTAGDIPQGAGTADYTAPSGLGGGK